MHLAPAMDRVLLHGSVWKGVGSGGRRGYSGVGEQVWVGHVFKGLLGWLAVLVWFLVA